MVKSGEGEEGNWEIAFSCYIVAGEKWTVQKKIKLVLQKIPFYYFHLNNFFYTCYRASFSLFYGLTGYLFMHAFATSI